MSKAWTDKTEYKIFSGQLASSSRHDFERAVLPFIRIIWADTFAPKMLGAYDRIGIDLLVWADREPFALVVQCKGFETSEEEIGQEQIDQCLKSIASFEKSGKKAETYLFVHNRLGRHAGLRSAIETALNKIKKSGQVKHVTLWDRQLVLRHAFNKIHERVREFVTSNASVVELEGKTFEFEPLHDVPLQTSELVVSPYKLEKASSPRITITDPCSELLRFEERNLNLMIGEAGFGKTTAALRTFQSGKQIFYVPGSTFSAGDASTKGFLQQWVNLDEFLGDYQDRDIPTVKEILSAVVPQILKERNTPLVLVIDGLDESIFFSYRGGLQWLFNHLRDVFVPVVLLARSELWHSRLNDFATSIGQGTERGAQRRRKIRLIELLPWSKEQIAELARRYRQSLTDPDQQGRIDKLIASIEDDSYLAFYGDIPSRPLFLRFILDTVAEQDVHRTGRAQLYYEWARMKIARDVVNPMKWGSVGRAPLASTVESVDETIRLSFQAMMSAAFRMTQQNNGIVELLPSCNLDDVLLSQEQFKGITDPAGLFLNSLLLPVGPAPAFEPLRIRFAHRAYQEFFLSLYIKRYPDSVGDASLPDAVTEHLRDLGTERIEVA